MNAMKLCKIILTSHLIVKCLNNNNIIAYKHSNYYITTWFYDTAVSFELIIIIKSC